MARIERSALVRFSTEQMFALVNDVARYPEFMPGCVAAEVLEASESHLTARLTLKAAGVEQSFVTTNALTPPTRMDMVLVEGPFSHFSGQWQFIALGDIGCKIVFSLDFDLKNGLVALAAGKVFEAVASQQVDCLCRRAEQLYSG
ncbi:type II toxin-antitoxin system RatA family toxin [Simiduia sp. 21SJ11W-1]|uniref:type II toxin-antitoxin system RatA family toxin n=1 Tax=Simiduia sp. 21SJ11W-1 TaxID=2909669 RepID=UPI0020A0B88C|nr:type II toxin-antitoxin system RatA family toxin [Simiduia sp. 21SJ11W-1]UTA47043.1 type II toxin-antitoxin system RatA family toxin [Simiduia sp. 21SJ11W-1]